MAKVQLPAIQIDSADVDDAPLRNSSIPSIPGISISSSSGRPRSTPSPSNMNTIEAGRKTSTSYRFSAVLHDIEARTKANEEKKLRDLLNKMKEVKSSTLFEMIVVTLIFHLCVYVADVITDIINGVHHSETGEILTIKKPLEYSWF